ncbi:MAG TPA: ScpA family protein [Egibacteraceae bacterium]|nr:ScpA family protein [Egibacteraceae bacterium]
MSTSYTVSIDAFEGPFDLLLHLIARHKMDIYDVPLSQITDDYLAVLREMEQIDLEVATDFLVVAATLIELKAARLLPGEDDPELEDLALEARDLLYARLLDYRSFKEAASFLAARLSAHSGFVPREVVLEERYAALMPEAKLDMVAADLAALATRVLSERPPSVVDIAHLQPVRMSVREAATLVTDELARAGGAASFRELTAGCRHRVEVVICFLAVLELYKLEMVDLKQPEGLGELIVVAEESAQWSDAALAALEHAEFARDPVRSADG